MAATTGWTELPPLTRVLIVPRQNRRWSSAQAREFLHLHSTLALITLHSDLSSQRIQCETLNSDRTAVLYIVQFSSLISHLFSCLAPGGFTLQVSAALSSALLPLHTDIQATLFSPEGQPYLLEVTTLFVQTILYRDQISAGLTHVTFVNIHQVMFAMRELPGPLSVLIEMVTYTSYCNESFSLGVLQLLKVKTFSHIIGVGRLLVSNCSLKSSDSFVSHRPNLRWLHLTN